MAVRFHKTWFVTPNPMEAGEVSFRVKKEFRRLNLPREASRRACICLYEGEINMAIHAGGGTMEVEVTDRDIAMILTDKGPGIFDVEEAMKEGVSHASPAARHLGFGAGMGLPNMKRNADDMQIISRRNKGTTIRMTVNYKN